MIGFAVVAITGFAYQIGNGKTSALSSAERQLALVADVTALHLKDETLSSSTDWQGALAGSLPRGATRDGRTALLADAESEVQARAPIDSPLKGNLLTILGPQQPLTIMGANAGVLRITLLDGTDALVTVRNVPETDAQIAFVQPSAARSAPGAATRSSRSRSWCAPDWCSRCSPAAFGISCLLRRHARAMTATA
ncbi:hypothetical protein AUC69_08740 [Methyloceanibacter superfactus]|uniref:Uncharacterized protein n=1 Tax=Methyloceanibacter superfactus TaxID=1774969 RepID=A0A1E3W1R7_9HYPH|nr:hypothetical protein AUC69_08740 [Methyloceanibacter superfactus]